MKTKTSEEWRRALAARKKSELIDFLLGLAHEGRSVRRSLQSRFDLKFSPAELIAATRTKIALATNYDDQVPNSNFDYDYQAYDALAKQFAELTNLGMYKQTMDLAVTLMTEGSRQVEFSDEGMMTQDIEACLDVVIKSLKKGAVPASEVVAWCDQMVRADRVGFICDQKLRALREIYQRR
jgi:hypothetical protein